MKYLLLIFLLPFNILAQSGKYTKFIQNGKFYGILPVDNESIFYSGVVQVDSSIKKDELYARAKRFFVDNYKSAKDVIQLDDKENGEIDGKGLFETAWKYSGLAAPTSVYIYQTFKIYVKDGRYKYEISNFKISSDRFSAMGLEYFLSDRPDNKKKFALTIDSHVNLLIDLLKGAMVSKSTKDF